eukprot:416193_1
MALKSRHKYKPISLDEKECTQNIDITLPMQQHKGITKKNDSFWKSLFRKPLSKLPFFYFIAGILGALILTTLSFLTANTSIVLSLSGAYIVLNIYACWYFNKLRNVISQVEGLSFNRNKLKLKRLKLSAEVDKIATANARLTDQHARLMDVNEKNRENLDSFRTIQENMEVVGASTVDEMTDLVGKSRAIESKWHDQLYEHERNLLHTVFERMEQRQGSRMGMNAEQFKEFENQLPQEYKHRFDRMGTFHHLAKGQSLIQYDDFRCVLDVFAEMATDNVDIEFEIQKTATPRSKHKKQQKSKQQVKFRSMDPVQEDYNEESSFQFKKFEPNNVSNIGKLKEVESIDLEDIKFDEDDDDAPQLYDRKVVRTKRTMRGSRFREDLSIAALMDDNIDYGSGSGSGSDNNNARESMFGQELDTPTSGIELDKRKFKVPGQSNDKSKVKLNTHGRKKFASLLDDVDNQ